MLLPYATTERMDKHAPPQPMPYVTVALMLATLIVAVFVELAAHGTGPYTRAQWFNTLGLVPNKVMPLALFTYPFIHAGIGHLVLNLCYLFVFGSGVEAAVGKGKMLLLYLLGGAVGGTLQILVTRLLIKDQIGSPIVGASAACSALIGLYAVRYYRARLAFMGIPFKPQVVAVVLLILSIELISGLYSVFTRNATDGIAHWAHLGGFSFGLGCAYLLRLDLAGQFAYLQRDAAADMQYSVPGEAIKRWQTVLGREPENPVAHAEIAKAWLLFGDGEQAESHFLQAIEIYLDKGSRSEAALLFVEMREQGLRALPPATQLFALGSTLEELEQHALAAEILRAVTVHSPDAPEAETALLKVAGLYLNRLQRHEEAMILLRLFRERYAHSPLCRLADEMQKQGTGDRGRGTGQY
jgi:membrane associated rhomboid family serine protease